MTTSSPTLFPELGESAADAPDEHGSGILPSQRIRWLIERRYLSASAPILDEQIQPASVDLRLGAVAYRVRASFLPNGAPVARRIEEVGAYTLDLREGAVLERGCVYLVPLQEELTLPAGYSAKANPKSTTGRLDVFTRVIADHGMEFERIPTGFHGRLYLEVVPRTFSILVREGTRLSQLRFWRGNPVPSDRLLSALHEAEALVYSPEGEPVDALISRGVWISVDLVGIDGTDVVGYRARRNAPIVDLARVAHYDPRDFWEPIPARAGRPLVLEPDEFHILVSRELVRVPPTHAAEMVAYDAAVGEFRAHYAGFFDPGFGDGGGNLRGTRAVLEVRSHEVPFLVEDGQRIARLVFERLQAVPDKLYGPSIGSSYQAQGLRLSKQFRTDEEQRAIDAAATR